MLYGEINTPLFFALTSGEICFLEANLNPFGKTRIPPTFKSAGLPSALIC